MIRRIEVRGVLKALKKLPTHVRVKFQGWVQAVERQGVEEIRKIKGYHDEPLEGDLKGLRSVRLSKGYRAIYRIEADGEGKFIQVTEVGQHPY